MEQTYTDEPVLPLRKDGDFDYIICGGGCAGLSLAVHLIQAEKFKDKQVLIIEEDAKLQNDRTWCFWERGKGMFEPIVLKQWQSLQLHNNKFSKWLHIHPYAYKLIRGLDFYNYCRVRIKEQPNFHFKQARVTGIAKEEKGATVTTDGDAYRAKFVFNSIIFTPPVLGKETIWMLQHFKGWFIKTENDAFDPTVGTLMDFRTPQAEGTSFFYVLPFSEREALVEYTLFSPKLLEKENYEVALEDYISKQLGITGYTISEKEFGVIPMTNHPFLNKEAPVMHIGTAGGYTKGSSGYTFQFIQKSSAAIVASLVSKGHPFGAKRSASRFSFYDSVLLRVLKERSVEGAAIFTALFEKNDPGLVLQFLDNETSVSEELKIISSLPVLPFAKAAAQHLLLKYC